MALANCARCGALFNQITRDICRECYEEEERLLREIQHYLRENGRCTFTEIMDTFDLRHEMLDRWCKEKRIQLVRDDDKVVRKCQYCGREVTGLSSICKTCELKRGNHLQKEPAIALEPHKRAIRRMHYHRDEEK